MKGKRTRADAKVREAEKAAKRAAQGNKPKKIAAVKATETGTATAQKPEVSCFISDFDQYLFGQGNHYDIFRKLGAHLTEHEGQKGVHFAVWAPGRGHFDNRESSYHILGRFASGAGRFRGISAFFLLFSSYYGILSSTLYGKEGTPAMGWNGCVFFKKGNP